MLTKIGQLFKRILIQPLGRLIKKWPYFFPKKSHLPVLTSKNLLQSTINMFDKGLYWQSSSNLQGVLELCKKEQVAYFTPSV